MIHSIVFVNRNPVSLLVSHPYEAYLYRSLIFCRQLLSKNERAVEKLTSPKCDSTLERITASSKAYPILSPFGGIWNMLVVSAVGKTNSQHAQHHPKASHDLSTTFHLEVRCRRDTRTIRLLHLTSPSCAVVLRRRIFSRCSA